jgi:hypothetical protein
MGRKQVLLKKLSPFFKLFEHNNSLNPQVDREERIDYCLEYDVESIFIGVSIQAEVSRRNRFELGSGEAVTPQPGRKETSHDESNQKVRNPRPVGLHSSVRPPDERWRRVGKVRSKDHDLPQGSDYHDRSVGVEGSSGAWRQTR